MSDDNKWSYRRDKKYVKFQLSQIQNEVLRLRIMHELGTYIHGAHLYKWLFILSQVFIVALPVVIIYLQQICDEIGWSSVLVAGISAISTITNVLSFQTKWKHYRSYCEILKQEISYYLLHIGKYDGKSKEERDKLLSEKIEKYVEEEGEKWKHIKWKKHKG